MDIWEYDNLTKNQIEEKVDGKLSPKIGTDG